MTLEQLRLALSDFDGVALSILSEAQVKLRQEEDFLSNLVKLSVDEDGNISVGATWILKAEIDQGTRFSHDIEEKLLLSLDKIVSWQSVLHICQIMDQLHLSEKQAETVIKWAKAYTKHERPFIRAWSMHAIVVAGRTHNKFSDIVESHLKSAEEDHAGSVQARARQLRKVTG
jgi:hypothetical protein